jgi:PAS domain S-box-containing protein
VDIAERKEEALKESERRFATVLANARAYVYRCRNEEGYPNEFASDYALELTGYPSEDLMVGGPVRFGDLIVEEDRRRVWEEVQGALGSRERFELRYTIRRRDGELRHVEEFGLLTRSSAASPDFFIGLSRSWAGLRSGSASRA